VYQVSGHCQINRVPELELLRHLRNGVAHGNVFRIDNPASLIKFPAHNRLAWVRSDSKAELEITPSLQGQPVLIDFMAPGDLETSLISSCRLAFTSYEWATAIHFDREKADYSNDS
jgi:hypothetical protein